MASAAKSGYHHGDLRQSLIDAAIALINEEGVRDLSLRQIARRVGVSHNAPYRHFEDKEALLAAVAEQGFQALRSAMETARQAALNNSVQQLEAIGIAYVNFALAYPAHYRVMFGEYHSNLNPNSTYAEAAQQAFAVLVNTMREGQETGVFCRADPVNLAWVAWSLVHGQAMLLLDHNLQVSPGKELIAFLQFSSRILVEGLKGKATS